MALSRRELLAQSASLGAALAALVVVPGPVADLLTGVAPAANGELSPDNLRTFVAVCQAVCSFDGRTPPPARADGRPQPTAADTGARFAAEYRAQSASLQQTFDTLLTLVEQAPRVPPPIGATSAADLAAYGGRSFSELDVPLRLSFLRSWGSDFNQTPVGVGDVVNAGALPRPVGGTLTPVEDPLGTGAFHDVGTLHRAVASALIQLASLFYYEDPRSWTALGYGGPWLGRPHDDERMPFSLSCALPGATGRTPAFFCDLTHADDDTVNRVLYGDGVVA